MGSGSSSQNQKTTTVRVTEAEARPTSAVAQRATTVPEPVTQPAAAAAAPEPAVAPAPAAEPTTPPPPAPEAKPERKRGPISTNPDVVKNVEWDLPRNPDERRLVGAHSVLDKYYKFLDGLLSDMDACYPDGHEEMREKTTILNKYYFADNGKHQSNIRSYGSRRMFVVMAKNYIRRSLDMFNKKTLVDPFQDSEQALYQACRSLRAWIGNFCNMEKNALQAGQHGVITELCEDMKQATEVAQRTCNFAIYHERHIYSSINILWNCSTHLSNLPHFREAKAVEALVPVLKCTVDVVRAKAMMTLCHIVDETENKHLVADGGATLDFIVETLTKAVEHPHLYFELPDKNNIYAFGLCNGLQALARIEQNKRWITEKGGVPPIVRFLEKGQNTGQYRVAAQALWQIAFDETGRREILKTNAVTLLEKYKGHSNAPLKQAAEGALWELRDRATTQQASAILDRQKTEHGEKKEETKKHIMLSYQHGFREPVLKLRDRLRKEGFTTWMDVDQMEAHLYDSMATAVEEAFAVVACYSESYKDSPPCRSEACYAQDRRVPIIPVKVEPGYRADGWLGFLISGQKYIDLSGKYPFELECNKVVNHLKEQRALENQQGAGHKGMKDIPAGEPVAKAVVASSSGALPPPPPPADGVETWSNERVKQHLVKNKVKLTSAKLEAMTGEELKCLSDLSTESPEFYNNYLKDELEIKELMQLAAMRKAISSIG